VLAVGSLAVGNISPVGRDINKCAIQNPFRLIRKKDNTKVCGYDTLICFNRKI